MLPGFSALPPSLWPIFCPAVAYLVNTISRVPGVLRGANAAPEQLLSWHKNQVNTRLHTIPMCDSILKS
jgi:hypothetical protein